MRHPEQKLYLEVLLITDLRCCLNALFTGSEYIMCLITQPQHVWICVTMFLEQAVLVLT